VIESEVTVDIRQVGALFTDFLSGREISLTENSDGRLESLHSEDAVTSALRERFGSNQSFTILPKSHNRSFGDIDIQIGSKVYPINIKMVSESTSTYNGGGPKVFQYVLLGKSGGTSWTSLVKRLSTARPKRILNEYFYLVMYKRSNRAPVFVSLTDIAPSSIVTNPSNPIQLKRELEITLRSEEEKASFILGLLEDVLRKRAAPYLALKGLAV
jgi:hypothetical protein